MARDKVDELYDNLKEDGWVENSREHFRAFFLAPGAQGYKNRKALYDNMKEDGYVDSPTYEEFARRMGMHATQPKPTQPTPQSKPATPTPQAKPSPNLAAPNPAGTYRAFKVRRGGKDMFIPETEVKAAGGLYGWAAKHPGAPLRVYMHSRDNGRTFTGHVDLSEAHNHSAKDGYFYTTVNMRNKAKPAGNSGKGIRPTAEQAAQFHNSLQQQVATGNAQLRQQTDNAVKGMDAIKKGSRPDAGLGEVKINPKNGKWERQYTTVQGKETGSRMEQSQQNTAYNTWWENNTEQGRRSKEQRLQREFDERMAGLWRRNDSREGANAVERAWNDATQRTRTAQTANADRTWDGLSAGPEMRVVNASLTAHGNQVARLTNFDLDRLMNESWNNLGTKGQKALVDDCYKMLVRRYPGADGIKLYEEAKKMARQQSDLRLYNYAVEKNLPKSGLAYLMRKIGDMNMLGNIQKGLAVSRAGSTGDMAAYEAANEQYRQDGHKVLDIAGTVAGFALDPTTWLSGGVGSATTKGVLSLAGRGATAAVKKAATRKFATSMTGRVLGGMAGGAANFGTFEGIKELENQFAHGGKVTGQDDTGRYVNERYSVSAVGGQALHGFLMGGAIGWLSPVSGNVSDRLVGMTESTIGKVATRAGVFTGATIAEGTIFSVPEWMEGERDGFDVWTDNMAMMAGFKAKHMLKSAGGVLGDLQASFQHPSNGSKNRLDFESRLRMRMDAPSDGGMALTKDEKDELQRYGYDLSDLVKSSERTGNAAEGSLIARNAPEIVSRLTDMMTDSRVSEAARAKMYYYATGRKLPMSTVMRGELMEDGKGGFIVESQGANGVITSRRYTSRKAADLELHRIRRQVELNQIELGERYQQTADLENRLQDACRSVAAENGWDPVTVYRLCEEARNNYLRGENKELDEARQHILRQVTEAMGEFEETAVTDAMRGRINDKYGVDIDSAIRKEPARRSDKEQKAIDEYIAVLFPEKEKGRNPVMDAEDLTEQQLLPENGTPAGEPAAQETKAGEERAVETPGEERAIETPGEERATEIHGGENSGVADSGEARPIGRAVMKYQDRQVEVLSGNIVMTEDGTMVDNARSDSPVVIRDIATGKKEMVSPQAILSYESYPAEPEPAEVPEAPARNYGKGVIRFRDSDGRERLGWITGDLDDKGMIEYYAAGERRLRYATEEELDGMVTSYEPDKPKEPEVEATTPTSGEEGSAVEGVGNSQYVGKSEGESLTLPRETNDLHGNRPEQNHDERTQPRENDGSGVAVDAAGGMEADRDRSDIRVYTQGLAASRDEHSEHSTRNRRRAESERLVGLAKANGQFLGSDQKQSLGDKHPKGTGESEVYIDRTSGIVYKVKDPYAKSPMKGAVEPEDTVYEHLVHNKYFPETRYRFEGISEDLGDARIVLSQKYVDSVGQPTKEQIETTLAEKGLLPEGKYTYGNDEVSVTDVTGDNALLGADGKVYFIDPIINFKKPVQEILGEQPAASAERTPTPLQRIPRDAAGEPIFEQAENPEHGWDALVEFAEGDAATAKEIADTMAEEKRKAYEKAQKQKPKGKTPTEILASKKAISAGLAQAEQEYNLWQQMANVEQRRQAAIRSKQEAEARQRAAERAEAARLEREALEGIPEWHLDTPENARKRGVRRFSGQMFTRQEPVQGVVGKEVEVKFSQKDLPKGHLAVIEAPQLQPSHIQGQRNPMFFIEEAEPKNRAEAVSMFAAKEMAEGIRPQEITSSATAYTGAPTVNTRGEVIQGNNRSDALRYLWENKLPEQQQAYKQYLIDNAEQFGLDPEAVNAMQQPVLVNMLNVDDSEAIRLGQLTAQDTESGGIERIKPKNVAQKLGEDMRSFATQLLHSGDEEASFSQLVDRNGTEVMKWMAQKGAITNTQYQSAFDSKGNLTAEAKNDLQKVLYQAVFKGGSQQLEEKFETLPAKAQRAILATAFRDMDSPFAGKMVLEIQASIMAYDELMHDPGFAGAKKLDKVLRAVDAWKRQSALDVRFEQYYPSDNYSNFALHLASLYKASDKTQSYLTGMFNEMYDLAQGKKEATLFEEADTTEYPLADVIKQVLNIDYKPAKNGNNNVANGGADVALRNQDGQGGELRGNEPPAGGEQNPAGTEPSDRGAGTSDDSRGVGERRNLQSSEKRSESETSEIDENGLPFVVSENGTTSFGEIREESGLPSAPIKLSEGYQDENGKGYGLRHIEAGHGDEIRNSGFSTVEEFVSYVAKNYDEDNIRVGKQRRNGNTTYLIQVTDSHDNTLFIELSRDGSYWNVNSGGVFRKGYSNKKETVAKTEPQQPNNAVSSDPSLSTDEQSGTSSIEPNGESTVSDRKVNNSATEKQESGSESSVQLADNKGEQTVQAAVEAASAQVNTEPTPSQAEAGNYKKGHVTIGEFDITIENPAGSVRKGIDADGKEWSNTMANTYGYIKGTEGVDGDHIDVFLHSDMDQWNGRKVFVVDQTNTDGSFDEHKVMLGFNDKDEAMTAYLANYDKTWADTHSGLRISETSIEDFNKWVQSSHRKTKPFADYTTVSKVVDEAPVKSEQQQPEQPTANIGQGYKIESKPYTNKQGKTLDTYLVTFDRDFSKEELSALRAKAKALKGWYDRESKGWMLRGSDDAKAFADEVTAKSEDEVADEAPLSMADMEKPKPAAKPTESPMKQVDVEGVFDALKTKGETKLSDHAKPVEAPKPKKRRWISDEDADEFDSLRKDLRSHFGKDGDIVQEAGTEYGKPKQMDAEVLRMGTRMTYLMMKGGLRSFSDYCDAMKDELPDIFDEMRPHLKSLYAAAQNMEEVIELGWDEEMDDRKTVKAFDVYNFDKPGAKDIIATAQHAVDENASQQQTDQIIQTLKDQRNEQRKEEADKTSADTEAISDKAEATASQVESELEDAETERDAERLSRSLDKEIEEVNKQLALLGYYEADPVEKDFNEAYGYMRNAERKAVEDAHRLATQLAADLGITIDPKDKVRKAKYGFGSKIARSNVAPAGGEVYITLPLAEGRELKVNIYLEPSSESGKRTWIGDNLMVTRILYTIEGGKRSRNCWAEPNTTYDELLADIRREVRTYLPEEHVKPATPLSPEPGEDYVDMAKRVSVDKESKSRGVKPQQTMTSLFGDELGYFDSQGNPIDGNGKYVVEEVESISEISDDDFTKPTRNVVLPELSRRVSDAIGAEGRRPMIKKNIFGKNRDSHKDLTAEDGRRILNEVLYNPNLYGQNQKVSRPYNWIMVHLADKNSAVVLEVNPTKEYLEIVNWHYIGGEALARKKRQAVKEGGRILTLQVSNAAAYTHDELSSDGKGNNKTSNNNRDEKTDLQPRTEETGRGGQQPRPNEPLGEGAKHEDERTDGGRMAKGSGEHSLSDTGRGAGVSELRNRRRKENDGARRSVGREAEQNREVYELTKGLLESAGVKVHEVGNEEAQRMLDARGGDEQLMGSRTDRKMSEISEHFAGRKLDENQQAVVDVFSGKADNRSIEVAREDGAVTVVMRQGKEPNAGTKHSLYRHYGTSSNYITVDDIAMIPEIIAKGERTVKGNKIAYDYVGNEDVRLRVTTEIIGRQEKFTNFLSNRKPLNNGTRRPLKGDTQLSAQASDSEVSDAKVSNSDETAKISAEEEADKRYLEAVERGDMKQAQAMVNEAAERAGYNDDSGYQGTSAFNGAAPYNGYGLSKEERRRLWESRELEGDWTLGDDIDFMGEDSQLHFMLNHRNGYASASPLQRTSISALRDAINSGTRKIKVYRSVPSDVKEGSLRDGDWVTPSKEYANDNAAVHGWGNKYRIIEQEVDFDELWWDGNDINEWGYDSGSNFGYRNTKNNRKSLDAVTYDDNGKVIPLSKRFDSHKKDVRYMQTPSGVVYGWTADGEVWLNRDAMNPETPLHEYTHLWDEMVRRENPELWARGKELMKETPLWQEVMDDPNYADIRDDEDAVASEVHSRLMGKRGAERMKSMIDDARKDGPIEVAKAVTLVERLKGWLREMFGKLKETLGKWSKRDLRELTAEQFADMTLRDLAEGVNPRSGDRALVAVHNISESKLKEALTLGGLPMPSIAVTKASMGHTEFGEISLVFGKESIDPRDRRNKVYSGDAWSPTFPTVGYKLNSAKTSEIYERANNAGRLPLFRAVDFHPDNYERRIESGGDGSLVEAFLNDYSAKQLYLSEKGEAVTEYERHEVEKYSAEKVGLYEKMLEKIGEERLRNESYEALLPELKKLIGEYRGDDFDSLPPAVAKMLIKGSIRNAVDYADNGNLKTETDIKGTEAKIDGRIDGQEYRKWLEELFAGVVEKKGIRNERDMFTPSGNSRKWESLYDAVTLDNVVKAMQRQAAKGGAGLFNSSIFGASTRELKDIEDIRKEAKARINSISSEEYEAEKDRIKARLNAVVIPSAKRDFASAMDFVENVTAAVAKTHTADGIYRQLNGIYSDMTPDAAREIADIVGDIENMATRYFEAKPQRAVSFGEVKLAVVPEGTSAEIVEQLERHGIQVRTYERGNERQRTALVSRATSELGLRFHAAMARGREDFDAMRERAVRERGIVMPGLNEAAVRVVDVPKHDFTGTGRQAIEKARSWAIKNLVGEHLYHEGMTDGFRFIIDEETIGKYLSASSTKGSDNLGIHLACLKSLPTIIDNSIEAEIHADYAKSNGKRAVQNGMQNPNILIHRYYGASRIDGKLYRVKTTIKETREGGKAPYNYQVTELELLISGSETSDALSNSNRIDAAKLLKGVEKSYDSGKKLLEESVNVEQSEPGSEYEASPEGDIRYREVEDDAVLKEFAEGKTDQEIERINAHQQEMAQTSAEAKSSHAEKLAKRFNTPIEVVTDINELTSEDTLRQTGLRRSKGFYDPATGKVVVVLPNNANVEDVAETVFHEVVAHKGLREMLGDENYDVFCDEVYNHLKDDLKEEVDRETTRRFEREPEKGYEHARRVSVDEVFGRMAEKGFEDFTKAERGIWAKLKAKVLEAINKFLGALKLPKWVKLGDNELRYMLWRSHERLRVKGDYVDMARDAAKREELGLDRIESVWEREGDANIEVANKRFNEELTRYQNGEMKPHEILHLGYPRGAMRNFLPNLPIVMRQRVIRKGSEKKHDVDVSAIMNMPNHLASPIFIFQRSEDTIGVLTDMKDRTGKNVCVAIELKRQMQNGNAYLEVNDVRSFHGRDFKNIVEPIVNNHTLRWVDKSKGLAYLSSASQPVQQEIDRQVLEDAAKVIKSFENPTIVEEESEYRYRDGETGDIWKDRSVGLQERITNAAIRLSNNQRGDLTLRNDAMRAIGGNLTELRKAMAAQKAFDRSTVKRVSDLARILMQNGYLSGMTSGEVQRLLSAVKNSVGHNDVKDSVQKIMDIMVNNQLRNTEGALRQLLSIRGSKVDARGVEVQGVLDVEGQRTMEVVKEAMTLSEDDITDRIAEAMNRMGDPYQRIADQAAIDYAGLNMALDYVQNIANSKAEEKTLRDSLKTAKEDRDAGRMTDDAYKQFVEATEDAIRKNKVERAEAYFNLVGRLSDFLRESIENAKAFREAEKARVNRIHHFANSDMEGRPTNEHHKDNWKDKFVNNGFVQILFAPLGTFDPLCGS